jgi:uridine kinase
MYGDNKDIFDAKIYVETDLEIRKDRFLRRAYMERNQDLDNAKKHWDYILGAGEKYVQPYRKEADIIINGDADLGYFTQILEYIHTITNNFNA